MALFQLGDFRNAERRYLRCLDCLPPEVAVLPYRPLGLRFSLHRTQIEWNVRLARLWKQHKRNHTEVPTSWCLNRLPAGRLFEARPRAEELASSLDDDPPPEAADPKGDAGVRPYPGDGGSLQGNLFEQRQKKEASDDDATLPAPAAPLTSSIPRSRRITTFPPTDYSAPSSPGLSATFRQGDE
ncbi:MAG: hypothetical protein M1838_000430 [Thelocarpon superellum]|nr:MAG: hypothetical protein M1838_000430 [Thelocarpon superellum]